MKRRSILISCVALIMALAVFVGCDNGPVYPHIAQSATLEQTATLLEGQVIPADAFKLTVSYLDGTTETRNVLPTEVTDRNGTADNGEKVEYLVGYDGRGIAVKPSTQISAYPVDHVSIEIAPEAELVVDVAPAKADLIVTAYYIVGSETLSTPVAYGDITDIAAVSSVQAAEDATLETVDDATFTLKVFGTEETVSGVTANLKSTDLGEVTQIDSIKYKTAIASYDYAEALPLTFDDVVIMASYEKGTKSVEVKNAEDLPGLTLSWVDATMKLPVKDFNFASSATTTIKIEAVWDGEEDPSYSEVINIVAPTITVSYTGDALNEGDEFSVDESKIRVIENVNGREPNAYAELSTDDVTLIYTTEEIEAGVYKADSVKEYDGTTVPGTLYVAAVYQGRISDTEEIDVIDAVNTASLDISVVGTLPSIEKLYYTELPSFEAKDALKVVRTWSLTGAENPLSSDAFTAEYYIDEETPLTADEIEAGEDGRYDLTGFDNLLIKVTYENLVGYVEVALVDPVAAAVSVTANTDNPAFGTKIDWTVITYNANGVIDYAYDGDMTIYVDGEIAANFPATLDGESHEVVVVIGELESDSVTVDAGQAYIDLSNVAIELKEGSYAYIGDKLSTLTEAMFDFVENSWNKTEGEGAEGLADPTITDIEVFPSVATVKAEGNEVKAVVTYTGVSGEEETAKIDVTFNGTAYAAPSSSNVTLTHETVGAFSTNSATDLPAGTYLWADFATNLVGYGIDAADVAEFTYTPGNGDSSASGSTGFNITNFANGTISVTYTAKDSAAENGVKETTVTFAVNGVAAN